MAAQLTNQKSLHTLCELIVKWDLLAEVRSIPTIIDLWRKAGAIVRILLYESPTNYAPKTNTSLFFPFLECVLVDIWYMTNCNI